ncbi:MAG: tyrosine-type recombinase/integrase [Verrucomicrobiae bacterium]|nr:tyrosine-type recombinase/integrase [Verrucomicrobiae bacterium]
MWSKTDFRYWEPRVYRPRVTAKAEPSGNEWEGTSFHIRIQHQGRRGSFSTGECACRRAAKKAVEIYLFLKANGWEDALSKYRHEIPDGDGAVRPITVGEYIAQAESIASLGPRTFADYKRSFRRIVSDVMAIKSVGNKRFDYRARGRDPWVAKVDQVQLCNITPERVRKWANAYAKAADGDPLAEKRARNSANSTMRQAKSLFGAKILPHVRKLAESEGKELPMRLPFDGVEFFRRSSSRYHSMIDAEKLLLAAQAELPKISVEAWKIFLLALGGGLRRSEIDSLLWRQVDFERGVIRIEETPYFRPKSEDSTGEVELDPELIGTLRNFKSKASGPFVIESPHNPRPSATYSYTRGKEHFDCLYGWLRSQGIDDRKPLHVLRKEFGSLICEKFGLFAASQALRHADIAVTAAHYVDRKKRIAVGLGSLLTPKNVQSNLGES